jgi:hypothetical protein
MIQLFAVIPLALSSVATQDYTKSMKLFGRQNTNANVPPELQPYYEGNPDSNLPNWRRWLLIAAAVVVLIGIVIGIFFWKPWQSSNTSPTHKTPHSSSSTKNGDSTGTHEPQPSKVPSAPSNGGSGNTTPAPTPSNTPGGATTSPALTNTGPGDTLALFGVVTMIGGAAYQIRLRRRIVSNR